MPPRRPPTDPTKSLTGSFDQRYRKLEDRRASLIKRLQGLGAAARGHRGYLGALKLLNDTFRKAKLGQRLAVLEAASWLIDILEKLTM